MDSSGYHHAYIGFALMLYGFFLLLSSFGEKHKKICIFISIVGMAIYGDDLYQHYRQLTDPGYRSPLHVLYGMTLWKIELVRKLNEIADKIFRRK